MKHSPSVTKQTKMDFGQAMKEVLNGKQVRRLDWENPDHKYALIDGHLVVYDPKKKIWHKVLLNDGDLSGNDWVVAK